MRKQLLCLAMFASAGMIAQNFTLSGETPFIGTTDGSAHLVDVDGDGDLDFFNTGDQGGSDFQGIAQLFTNDGTGTFTLVTETPFPGVESDGSEFADIEGDGDMDLILTGSISGGRIANLYLNDGSGNFTLDNTQPFKDVSVGDVIIEDLDGDNDLDVIISGYNTAAEARITEVYKNNGANPAVFTIFTESPAFALANEGDVDVADTDGDGDLDLLITGDDGPGELTKFYTNDGTGVFTEDTTASDLFTDMRDSDADFADVDGDGDQDLLINGRYESSDREANLYLNNGTGVFSLAAGTPFIGGNAGTVDFFDVDNDGDQDVLISGYENTAGNRFTRLYSNDGSGNFTEETSESITGINNADIAIGDVDGNMTKDIIILGYSTTRIAEMYLNSGATLSIDKAAILNELSVYPNPTTDIIQVSSKEHEVLSMQLFDLLGKNVKSNKTASTSLDISSLSEGVYMLKINFANTSVVKKIIKK